MSAACWADWLDVHWVVPRAVTLVSYLAACWVAKWAAHWVALLAPRLVALTAA